MIRIRPETDFLTITSTNYSCPCHKISILMLNLVALCFYYWNFLRSVFERPVERLAMLLLRLLSAFAGLTGVAAREYYGTYIGKFQNRQDIQSKDYFVDVKTFAGSHSAWVVSLKKFFKYSFYFKGYFCYPVCFFPDPIGFDQPPQQL